MTARDDLDTGIAALGLLGGTENLPAAREAFRQAAELDPGMCDAWMGLAAAGDISTEILRCAHHTSATLHRETRRLGLRDDELAPVVPVPAFLELYPYSPAGLALAYIAALIGDGDYDTAEKLLDDIDLSREPSQSQIHRFLGAAIHYLTRRWTDVLDWTSRPVAAHNDVIDAATALLAGIAHTGLGQFDRPADPRTH